MIFDPENPSVSSVTIVTRVTCATTDSRIIMGPRCTTLFARLCILQAAKWFVRPRSCEAAKRGATIVTVGSHVKIVYFEEVAPLRVFAARVTVFTTKHSNHATLRVSYVGFSFLAVLRWCVTFVKSKLYRPKFSRGWDAIFHH